MSFPVMPVLMACLLWCAGLACVQRDASHVGQGGMAEWEKADGGASVILALGDHEPVRCIAKQRCIDPVWPHATAGNHRLPVVAAKAPLFFRLRPMRPDLEHAAWVGVIELRV